MPTALLTAGAIFAFLAALSLWPPRRPGVLAVIAWLPAWLVSELPLHMLVAEVLVIAPMIAAGGLDAAAGWGGLGLAALAAAGFLLHIRDALHTAAHVDAALRAGLGEVPHVPHGLDLLGLALIWPFRPRTVERVRNVCYWSHGKRDLCLDVYRARDNTDRNAPVFVYVHGGAWVIGNKGQQGRLTAHTLARAGWVCVSINYRLSPRATFPDHLHDVKRAIAWVKQHVAEHGGDPRFVVIGGGSAGAHLASLAALTPNVLEYQRDFPDVDTSLQGCVAYYGVYDFVDEAGAFPHRGFRDLLLERIVMKRRLAEAREEYEKASPRLRLGDHAPPFMILHGTRDTLAPLAGAHAFRDDLRRVTRAPVVWVELPGAQHAFEIFPSLRSIAAVAGVARFCNEIRARNTRDANSCQR